MTSPKTQIQALINKIDEVLGDSGTPRSSTEPSGGVPQQQVLEQARNYLASLQGSAAQGSAASPASPDRPRLDIAQQEWWRDRPATAAIRPANPPEVGYASPAESAQQVLQAIVQEMNYLRVNMMQPMREELMGLYQQRQFLTADIQRLEQQRHQLLLSQQQVNQQQVINDFMQSLMGRLQEQLATQIAQSVESLQFQATQNAGMLQNAPVPQLNPGESVGEPLTPGQRLQQMQQLQAKSDEMLTKLDSTLRVVFDSLQSNVDSYQDSLGQGLRKMHGLGQQGEAMFAALVNRLAEQLGRGASQYIQTSISSEWELPGLQSADTSRVGEKLSQSSQHGGIAAVPDELPQDQIDRMLSTLEPEDSPTHEPETDRSDDSLLDDLLVDLPQSTATQSVDFNLDDLQLPIDDSLMEAIAQSDASAPSEPEAGDGTDIDEMVTLFSIEDEGVIDRVDDQRLNQLEEQDADLFLSELNELTAHSGAEPDATSHPSETGDDSAWSSYGAGDVSGEIDHSQALDHGGAFTVPDDSDEALTFLDQIATEIESDLTSEEPPQEMTGDDLDLFDEESRFDESASTEDAPADEIEDVYQMFDSAVTSGLPSDSGFAWDSDEESQFDTEALDAPGDDHSSESSSDEIASALLDDFLFDDSASPGQTAASQSISDRLGSEELGSEAGASDVEDQTDDNGDIFSELGLSTQSTSADSSEIQSDQIETIHTLDELMGLDQPEAARQSGDDWMDEDADSLSSDDDAAGTDFDRYIMASPDEDLLASDDSDAVVGSNLKLDSTTMQRLASDLSGFEGIDESEVLLPSGEALESSFEEIGEDAEADSFLEGRSPTATPDSEESALEQQTSADADETFGDMSGDMSSDDPASTPFASLESVESSESAPDDLDPDMSDWDDFDPDESMSESLFAFGEDNFGEEDEDDFGLGEAEARESEPQEPEFESSEFESSEFNPEAMADEGTENEPSVTSEPSVTVNDLFGSPSESSFEDGGDRPEEQFDPLDSDELRQIFEDLKALDDQEIEPSPGSQEQTLVDLLKGVNQPSLPNLPDAAGEPEDSSAETDTSWSIFDDLKTSGSSSESEQKKNSDSV